MNFREPVAHTLDNGLRVMVLPQPHLAGASLSLFVKVGSRYESREKNGVSHFLEHMLFRGTPRFLTPHDLTFACERLGGMLEAATYADFTHYELSVPSEHAGEALGLLGDFIGGPRFSDIELEKKIVREEILADLGVHGQEVDPENLSRMLMFGEHPLGFKITGEVASVDAFRVEDLRSHLDAYYGASNLAVVATGAVDPAFVISKVSQVFGGRPRGRPALLEQPPPPLHDEHLRFVKHAASQTDLAIGFRAFGGDDPDYMALKLLTHVLDDGMSTRLHRRITDETGLAYDAYAALDAYEEIGVVDFGASVEHDKAPELLRTALELMSEFCDELVSEEELEKARFRYIWSLRQLVDSPEEMAMYAGTQLIFGRAVDLQGLLREVERIERGDLMRAARRAIRPERTHVVCVGQTKKRVQKATERVFSHWADQRLTRQRAWLLG